MNLLAGKLYDPGTAVTKATSALLAMTAFDTTNLRLAITVPAHGIVRFRMRCAANGATTLGSVLLGVMNGATVLGRIIPMWFPGTLSGATAIGFYEADFVVTGLTPGAMNVDAAYAVQVVVAATNIRYGGPNNNSGNNAWGGFSFEAWDPQPLKTGLDGGVNVTQYGGANGTFAGGRPEVNVSHFGGTAGTFASGRAEVNTTHWAGTAVGSAVILNAANIGADAITAAKIANGAIDAATFAAGAIDASAIADNAIDAGALAADCITAAKIANGAIDAATFTAGAIDATALAADAGTEIATAVWASGTRTLTASLDPTAAAIRAEMDANSVDLNTIAAGVAAIFTNTDVPTSSRAAPGDAMILTAGAIDAIFDDPIEGATTARELLRLYASALLAKSSGADVNSPTFRNLADSKDRITATTDAFGNRLAVTLDAT